MEGKRLTRRQRIYRRDGHRCVYCGEPGSADDLTLDHVEPRMRGGDASAGNLVTCCRPCNAAKGGQAAWAFLARNPDARARFMEAVARADDRWAPGVWDRLLRAIREAAAS